MGRGEGRGGVTKDFVQEVLIMVGGLEDLMDFGLGFGLEEVIGLKP